MHADVLLCAECRGARHALHATPMSVGMVTLVCTTKYKQPLYNPEWPKLDLTINPRYVRAMIIVIAVTLARLLSDQNRSSTPRTIGYKELV